MIEQAKSACSPFGKALKQKELKIKKKKQIDSLKFLEP